LNELVLHFQQYKLSIRIHRKNGSYEQNDRYFDLLPDEKDLFQLIDSDIDSNIFFDWEKHRKDENNRGVTVLIYSIYKEEPASDEYFQKMMNESYFSPEVLLKKLPSIRLRNMFGEPK